MLDLKIPLSALENSPVAAMVVRHDGVVLFCTREMSRRISAILPGGKVETGRRLDDGVTNPYVLERVELAKRFAVNGEDGVVRSIVDGDQLLSYMRAIPEGSIGSQRATFVLHERMHGPVDAAMFGGATFIEPEHHQLGVLGELSRREIEVLALIGEGMTAAQIAERICRTEETVNSHKSALLRKLQCKNATQLAIVAYRAGLKFSDGARFFG